MVAVLEMVPAMLAGEFTMSGIPYDTTLVVAASDSTSGVDAGCARIYGMSPSLPAETTPTMPKFTTSVNISLTSSSRWPNDPPMDMLMISTALFKVPVWFGSRAKSMPSAIATPLQEEATELQTFTAYNRPLGASPK